MINLQVYIDSRTCLEISFGTKIVKFNYKLVGFRLEKRINALSSIFKRCPSEVRDVVGDLILRYSLRNLGFEEDYALCEVYEKSAYVRAIDGKTVDIESVIEEILRDKTVVTTYHGHFY